MHVKIDLQLQLAPCVKPLCCFFGVCKLGVTAGGNAYLSQDPLNQGSWLSWNLVQLSKQVDGIWRRSSLLKREADILHFSTFAPCTSHFKVSKTETLYIHLPKCRFLCISVLCVMHMSQNQQCCASPHLKWTSSKFSSYREKWTSSRSSVSFFSLWWLWFRLTTLTILYLLINRWCQIMNLDPSFTLTLSPAVHVTSCVVLSVENVDD